MAEPRPHWDDSLVESVIHAISDYFDDEYLAYAVIAAVEDWARWEHVPKGTLRRLEQAEAAIQRVRGVVDLWQRHDPRRWHDSSIRHPADIPTVAIVAVRRALDGDA